MIKTRTVILVVFIAIIFCLSLGAIFGDKSSSNTKTSNKANDATSETKKVMLYAQLDKLDYNKETNKINLSLTTNIPDSTSATIKVYSSQKSENYDYTAISSEILKDGKLQATLSPSFPVKNGQYYVKITIDVSNGEYTSSNKHLIDTLGSGYKIEEQYSGSTLVKVRNTSYDRYTLDIDTKNILSIENGFSEQEYQQELDKRIKEREQREQQEIQQSKQTEVHTTTVDANSNGEAWLKLSKSEKQALTNRLLNNWKNNGYTVTADADWFIDALDAFYGTPQTNINTIADAMTLSGVAGGVVKK
ncbi:hypothetical protein [Bacillus bingmayongensis]|uniref:hypothetical protein n=1 Tax=Bacillus bingmayongensis TaxID=1150157 RepID=UPI00031831F4|nr:hypothetical protein [Bacillus bingmayongensis]MBY0600179.1 hypothetical protein [Bacillus bingmayongensis]